MTIQLHGFNWETYTRSIMPAFMNWLVEDNAAAIQQLYEKTRCAHEEAIMPPAMRPIQTWARAQSFIKQLPRGLHASREYRKLCSAEQFTALSDRYVYRYPPQLYQDHDALRAVWGAVVEEYCLSWLASNAEDKHNKQPDSAINLQIRQGKLLDTDYLKELAQKVRSEDECLREEEGEHRMSLLDEASRNIGPAGISLGRHPATLYIRGWLASISIRAMALFELLACGRRAMPFGYQACEPFESYIGYLTPGEVWQLALCLHNVHPPIKSEMEKRYRALRQQQSATRPETFRMPDETPPAHADALLKAVRAAASYGRGLICDVQ